MFKRLGALRQVQLEATAIESQSSLGLGEMYHEPLRTTYRKLKVINPAVSAEFILGCAVNDTLGPEGLVPSALVFGEYPSLRTISEPLQESSNLSNRAEVAMAARSEMSKIMAKKRVDHGLHHNLPGAADHTISSGDNVIVWRQRIHPNPHRRMDGFARSAGRRC